MPDCEVIVFSKDRALQLHALLTSYYDNTVSPQPVHVIFSTSSFSHYRSYEELMSLFPDVDFREEVLFKHDLLGLMSRVKSRAIMFLVDDMIFCNEVDIAELAREDLLETVPSLRLGKTLNKNYPWQRKQQLPTFRRKDDQKAYFYWQQGDLDWGYPLSLDGHIFSTVEFLELSRHINFHSPNSYEGALQRYRPFFVLRKGLCYEVSRAFSIPWNRVQDEYKNRFGQIDAEFLLERWINGYQLHTRQLYGLVVEATHQEVPPTFILRPS